MLTSFSLLLEHKCGDRNDVKNAVWDSYLTDHALKDVAICRFANGKTHPAGTKRPNAFGLYDMLGNVWEWCDDWYADYTVAAVTDPRGPERGKYRVLRGGAWKDGAADVRTTYRGGLSPNTKYKDSGFRIVARTR